uniref:DNA/RNA-binding protein Alba-like domain-containing protein n=1 Tax=Strombidium inclinatum TaxID=197538 RepID=A0A7S3N3C8_9SPIT|mmetsp:Transcript_39707/g.60853  ORF Transcript_39707/g.60853 Transcript_39707/m.60853 type:complete len:141 (+) Transcript_39707:2-424(+)
MENQGSRELKIDSNQINISVHRSDAFYVHLCKLTLEKYDEIVLHALGNATSTSVVASEKLVRNGYAEYVSMETKSIEVEESRRRGGKQESSYPPRMVKRPKLVVTLKKGSGYSEAMKQYGLIKEENDKYIAQEKVARESK